MMSGLLSVLYVGLVPVAAAQPQAAVSVAGGIIAGQPGGMFQAHGESRTKGFLPFGSVGVALRSNAMTTAVDAGTKPLAGLATAGVTLGAHLTDQVYLGPVVLLDAALLDAVERDCGQSFGCRHYMWLGGTRGVGMSVAPAFGAHLTAGGFTAMLGVQPTVIYDIGLAPAPRVDLSWTSPSGLMLGAMAGRYGTTARIGLAL